MKKLTSTFLAGYLKKLKVCKESREVILQTLVKERSHYPSCNHDLLVELILIELHYNRNTKEEAIMRQYEEEYSIIKSPSFKW